MCQRVAGEETSIGWEHRERERQGSGLGMNWVRGAFRTRESRECLDRDVGAG